MGQHPHSKPPLRAKRGRPPTFHRALHRLQFPPSRWLTVLLLPIAFNFIFWLGLNPITQAWRTLFATWLDWLELPAAVSTERIALAQWFVVELPIVSIEARSVDASIWFGTFLVSVGGLVASFLLPKHHVPLRYLLRLAVIVQATSLGFFALAPEAFHPTLTSHVRDGMLLALLFVTLVPWLYSLTYYIFDFSLIQKIALTLVTISYLLLFVPFQYLAHIWLLHHVSLLALPLLFLLFGVTLQILVFIALYGWGMSWECSPLAKTSRPSHLAKVLAQDYERIARRDESRRYFKIGLASGSALYRGKVLRRSKH